ncbi:MAG: BrnT family toxin [Bifidobacteriaceae bacterium]|jgi:uncharacterized DUF497 family protein|nr:BrnT family toxin [Bifidobacteriaceae bacterium]
MGGRGGLPGGWPQRVWPAPEFEYDPRKSKLNKSKHGIDFETAKDLWDDPLGFDVAAGHWSEVRFTRLARLGGKVYAAVWTPRGEVIRLISVRRAIQEEVHRYRGGNRRTGI